MAFVPTFGVLTAFTLAALILVMTPGPDMTLFLSRALTQGRAAGFTTMLGAASGIVAHTALAAFGLSALLAASPNAFLAVKIAGAFYLVWLAVEAIRNGSALALALEHSADRGQSLWTSWLTGLGINLLNPKIVLFFVTFLPQFVSAADPAAAGKLVFLGGYFIILSVPLCGMMILTADRFSAALRANPRITRIIDWLFAGIFGAFAVRILLTRTD